MTITDQLARRDRARGGDRPDVCLVTNELYPLSAGGIGRLMYNFAKMNAAADFPVELHFLVPEALIADPAQLARVTEAYGDTVTLHVVRPLPTRPDAFCRILGEGFDRHWTVDAAIAGSVAHMLALRDVETARGKPFDVVEFPDFGGWATATVEAKRAGIAFQDTLIAARLHSTQGMIYRAERYQHHPSLWLGLIFDAERHLLAHADIIVGHVGAVIEANRDNYRFEPQWRDTARLEFPPILPDDALTPAQEDPADDALSRPENPAAPDFIFSSRLQQFKRPDVFIRGALAFLAERPDYQGVFRVISYGWDQDYIDGLRSLIPREYDNRIVLRTSVLPDVREAYLHRSIVVVPSDYESLCLFAYEAGVMGRPVILNRACLAFGKGERWVEGDNALMFDGTPEDLARVMAEAIGWTPRSTVDATPDRPYYEALPPRPPRTEPEALPSLTLVVHALPTRGALGEMLMLLPALDLSDVAVAVHLPRALFPDDCRELALVAEMGFTAVRTAGFGDSPGMLSRRLKALDTDLVALLPYGLELHPHYLDAARRAFALNADLDLFGGHCRIVDDRTAAQDGIQAFVGEMPSVALVSSRICPAVGVLRPSVLDAHPFDDLAGANFFSVFARNLVLTGGRVLIAPILAADQRAALMRTEANKFVAGGVMDAFGRELGHPARLLAVEAREVVGRSVDRSRQLNGSEIGGSLLYAAGERAYALVIVRPDLGGLLIHPTVDGPTIGELRGPQERLARVTATVQNVGVRSIGVEFALAFVRNTCSMEDMVQLACTGFTYARHAISEWVTIASGQQATLSVATQGITNGSDRILFIARVPHNGDEIYAHTVVQSVRLEPVETAL